MGKVRTPPELHRQGVSVVTIDSRRSVTCDKRRIVTRTLSWIRNRFKSAYRRMRRPLTIVFLFLSATSTLGLFLEKPDPPPPPPVPDQAATIHSVDTLTEDDTVTAIERELESDLNLPHRSQIPAASSFNRHVDEAAKVIAVHVKEFQK